ncbi:phage tail protein [Azospirillum sp.]|uniref:phage tail protein n=1 Tax=Azospirillum sp. TaxID=34012 RepID=UPI003D75F000
MQPLTLTPPFNPTVGTDIHPEIKLIKADFGDGYRQRAPDGLNHIRYLYQFVWEGPVAEIDEILLFLHERGGTEAFLYTPPGESQAKTFVCQEWSKSRNTPLAKLSVKFTQVFDR